MTELVKSYRMYRIALNGLNFYSPSSHLWAFKTVKAYRQNRMQILIENQLGYTHQLRNMFKRQKEYGKNNNQTERIPTPNKYHDSETMIDIKRVSYYQEVKDE